MSKKEKTTLLEASYGDVLAYEQKISPAKRKGERKKASLLASAAAKLNEISYHQLRISDICDHANTSSASFYLYFENKKHISLAVLEAFGQKLYHDLLNRPVEEDRSDYHAIYSSNLAWLKIVRNNNGLMRCLLQVSFEDENFTKMYRTLSYEYNYKAAQKLADRLAKSETDKNKLVLKVFAYSAMTDEFTRRLIEEGDSEFGKIVEETYGSDEELANFLSDLWYKSIFE